MPHTVDAATKVQQKIELFERTVKLWRQWRAFLHENPPGPRPQYSTIIHDFVDEWFRIEFEDVAPSVINAEEHKRFRQELEAAMPRCKADLLATDPSAHPKIYEDDLHTAVERWVRRAGLPPEAEQAASDAPSEVPSDAAEKTTRKGGRPPNKYLFQHGYKLDEQIREHEVDVYGFVNVCCAGMTVEILQKIRNGRSNLKKRTEIRDRLVPKYVVDSLHFGLKWMKARYPKSNELTLEGLGLQELDPKTLAPVPKNRSETSETTIGNPRNPGNPTPKPRKP
jgi:hypothetical protein